MRIEWYGQSSFALSDGETALFIDPFGDMSGAAARGMTWEYPPIERVTADVLLVTHEHADHNAVEVIDGDPFLLRSLAGTHDSPLGSVAAVASEHDAAAGTQRGHNVMYAFSFGGLRVAHLGDLGQAALRPEQVKALGDVDLLFVPVGGHATIDAAGAHAAIEAIGPQIAIPMHYRTKRISFLDSADAFLDAAQRVERLRTPVLEDTGALDTSAGVVVAVPAAP